MATSYAIYYEGRLSSGEVVDTNFDDPQPFVFKAGQGSVFPALESAVAQLPIGEEGEFLFTAEQAFGERDERAVQRSFRSMIANGDAMQEGQHILMKGPDSVDPVPGLVTKVIGDFVEVDFNHPLAGHDLTYRIRLVGKQEE